MLENTGKKRHDRRENEEMAGASLEHTPWSLMKLFSPLKLTPSPSAAPVPAPAPATGFHPAGEHRGACVKWA